MVPIHADLAEERLTEFVGEHLTSNTQHPTSSQRASGKSLGVRGCLLSVECLYLSLSLLLAAFNSRAADYNEQFNQWFEVQTNIQSWSADFIQTRTLKVLNQPLISAGKVWVTTGEFRWELGQPAQTIVLRQPNQLLIVYPRLKQAEKYPLNGVPSGPMKDALTLLDATLPRDRATMEKSFRLLSAAETNSVLQMTLQPRSESARQFINQIVIGFHTNDFTDVVVNQPIDPKMFGANLPPDYAVVEPLKQ